MYASIVFARVLTTDNVLVIGKKIVKKTFGNATDGKDQQQKRGK
jgi:hypothetical protein